MAISSSTSAGPYYDGIWVGEDSKVPNIGGMRKELVDNLRKLNAPVVRWPEGCFADSYNWRDGIGPRAATVPYQSLARGSFDEAGSRWATEI
jgi:alpha-L-arabinofuranosidase